MVQLSWGVDANISSETIEQYLVGVDCCDEAHASISCILARSRLAGGRPSGLVGEIAQQAALAGPTLSYEEALAVFIRHWSLHKKKDLGNYVKKPRSWIAWMTSRGTKPLFFMNPSLARACTKSGTLARFHLAWIRACSSRFAILNIAVGGRLKQDKCLVPFLAPCCYKGKI